MAILCDMLQHKDRYAQGVVEQEKISATNNSRRRMWCCCCWSLYNCALILSVIDATIVGFLSYRTADLLYRSWNDTNWIDFGMFFVLSSFFICQLLSLLTLAVSRPRNNSRYVLPRLTLLTGQFAVTTSIAVILILYFMGLIDKLNDIVISSYEYWANNKLSEDDRKRAVNDLFMYAVGTFIFVFIYTLYELFELYITRKYQKTLDTPPEFIPVRNQEQPQLAGPKLSIGEPQQFPPPPYNPQYR